MMQVTIIGLKKNDRQQRPPQQLHRWYVKWNETKIAVSLSEKKKPKNTLKDRRRQRQQKITEFFSPLIEDKNPFHAIQRSQWSCCIFVLRFCHPTSRRARVSSHNGSRQSRSPFKQGLPQSSWTCLLWARLEKYHRRQRGWGEKSPRMEQKDIFS